MDADRDARGVPAWARTKECSPVTTEPLPTEAAGSETAGAGPSHAAATHPAAARPTAREINAQIVYTAFAVYARTGDLDAPADKATAELTELISDLAGQGVTLRGFYDV